MRRAALLLALAACGSEISGPDKGEELFHSADLSPSGLNRFSCAQCHEIEPGDTPTDGPPGYRLYGAVDRTRYWGGDYATVVDAVEACFIFFMKGDEIDPESDDFHALYEYLLEISPEPTDPFPFTVVENAADVERGDAERGEVLYDRTCQECHGEAFTADGSILREEVNLPRVTETYPTEFPDDDPSLVVIEKVRHGRFFGIGGEMPLFSLEAMSDQDLGDLLAYLEL